MKLSNESCPNGIKVTYGIWLMTKKMRRVNYSRIPVSTPRQTSEATLLEGCHSSIRRKKLTPVHISLCLNGVLRSGAATSGRMGTNGLMRSRNRTIGVKSVQCKSSRNINFVILLYKNEGNGYSQPLMIAVELREAYYNKSRKDREGNERRERGSPRDGSTLDESAVGGFLFGGRWIGGREGKSCFRRVRGFFTWRLRVEATSLCCWSTRSDPWSTTPHKPKPPLRFQNNNTTSTGIQDLA